MSNWEREKGDQTFSETLIPMSYFWILWVTPPATEDSEDVCSRSILPLPLLKSEGGLFGIDQGGGVHLLPSTLFLKV